MKEASALYRLLGDEARLRLLRVLDKDRFNVKELTGILGLAQSGVSRHLGLLKESDLVLEERDGAYSFYRLSPGVKDGTGGLWPLLQSQFDAAEHSPLVKADESRLQEVLRLRRENFEHVGPDTRDGRQLVPGREHRKVNVWRSLQSAEHLLDVFSHAGGIAKVAFENGVSVNLHGSFIA